jgi:hypothetical protein
MATIRELWDSRRVVVSPDDPTYELHYGVFETDDELEVSALVEATIPAFVYGLVFQEYTLEPQGGGVWSVPVRYGRQERLKPEDAGSGEPGQGGPGDIKSAELSFDTTGGTQKITHSYATTRYQTDGELDFKQAVNVSGPESDPKVEGVEATVPKFAFTVKRSLSRPLPAAYVQSLYLLTGRVNSDTVNLAIAEVEITFAPGELLYLGATGSLKYQGEAEITLKFVGEANVTGLTFGGITGVAKKGHEYLWVYTDQTEGATKLIPTPRQVNVERIYPTAALSGLLA